MVVITCDNVAITTMPMATTHAYVLDLVRQDCDIGHIVTRTYRYLPLLYTTYHIMAGPSIGHGLPAMEKFQEKF